MRTWMMVKALWLLPFFGFSLNSPIFAQTQTKAKPKAGKAKPAASPAPETPTDDPLRLRTAEELEQQNKSAWSESMFRPPNNPNHPRNAFLPPLVSFVLPGFDQWWEGQYAYAIPYSALGIAGIAVSRSADSDKLKYFSDLTERDPDIRKLLIGSTLTKIGGGLSSYHSFRTAVTTRPNEYKFLNQKYEESPLQLSIAPFKLQYLARPTTLAPLAILGALVVLDYRRKNGPTWYGLQRQDFPMTGIISYGAGLGEETSFRGFLMPWTREQTGSDIGSNLITATVFAAAHIAPDHPIPWPQFLFGYYVGWVSQRNNWTLSESIFIHTWWDVIAFVADYASKQRTDRVFTLPINLVF